MTGKQGMDRRGFIKTSAFGLAGVGTALQGESSQAASESGGESPKIKSYRTLGRTGFKVSDIGIGTSQTFPVPVMTAAMDAGVNYIDTGEGYGRGAAEKSIGEAIKGRDRKSLFITTKIRMDGIAGKDQVVEKVRQALERLQTGYVDCLMPSGPPTIAALKNEYFHQAMDQLRKEGLVRFVGVANHGGRGPAEGQTMDQFLLAAIDDGRFDLVLFVYNFLQKEAGERILEAAAAKNVATTIMKSNPLGRYFDMKQRAEQMKKDGQPLDKRMAGSLAEMEETAKKAESFLQKNGLKTPAEIKAAALKFVLTDSRVHTLNLAFNTFDDVRDSLALSGNKIIDDPSKEKYIGALEELLYEPTALIVDSMSQIKDLSDKNPILIIAHYTKNLSEENHLLMEYEKKILWSLERLFDIKRKTEGVQYKSCWANLGRKSELASYFQNNDLGKRGVYLYKNGILLNSKKLSLISLPGDYVRAASEILDVILD